MLNKRMNGKRMWTRLPAKRMGIMVIVASLLLTCLLFGACGSEGSTGQTEDEIMETVSRLDEAKEADEGTVEGAVETDISETENENPEEEIQSDMYYYYVGDTVSFQNGLQLQFLNAGEYIDPIDGSGFVYVDVYAENTGTEEIYIYPGNFYGDDYAMELGAPLSLDDELYDVPVAPGRKAQGRWYAECDGYEFISEIELEVGNVIIVIKEPYDWASEVAGMGIDIEQYPYAASENELLLCASVNWNDDGTVAVSGKAFVDGVEYPQLNFDNVQFVWSGGTESMYVANGLTITFFSDIDGFEIYDERNVDDTYWFNGNFYLVEAH